jgi:hypothetical protein
MSEQQLIEKLELQNYTKSKEIEILRINIINLNKEKARLEEELKIEKNRTLFDIIFRRNRSKK